MVHSDHRGNPPDCAAANARGGDDHLCRTQIMGGFRAAPGTQCRRPIWGAAKFRRWLEGILAGNHHPKRVEPWLVPDRADYHFHRRIDGMGGHSLRRWRGVVEYQCRLALHSGDQQLGRLRRGHCGMGLQLQISILFGDARRRADDFIRSLHWLHPDLRRPLGRHLQRKRHC